MILAKRVKKAFAYDAQGKLAPVSENIFTYSRRTKRLKAKTAKRKSMNVAILGATEKPERFANKAMRSLEERGHKTFLVNPNLEKIEGRPVSNSLRQLPGSIHTLAVYVNSGISSRLVEDIVALAPKRIIFNPGAENREIYQRLEGEGIVRDLKVEKGR